MVKGGLGKYKKLNDKIVSRIAVVRAGFVNLSALTSISEKILKICILKILIKLKRELGIQNVIFHNIEKLRLNLGKIDILIMALRDKKNKRNIY